MKKRCLNCSPIRRFPLILLTVSVLLISSMLFATVSFALETGKEAEESEEMEETTAAPAGSAFVISDGGASFASGGNADPFGGKEGVCGENLTFDLQYKKGPPEICDDAMLRYYLVDGSYYEVSGIYNSGFPEVVIPSEMCGIPVKGIRKNAFREYQYLVSVVIPESVEYIGDYAFYNCPKLKTVLLPESEITIGEGVFQSSE